MTATVLPIDRDRVLVGRARSRGTLAAGAVAGLVGGVVFGAAMAALGTLATVASIVRADSPVVGLIVHLAVAALVGIGFAVVVADQRAAVADVLLWGLVYGVFWWLVGPLTLLPLTLGEAVAWDLGSARDLFPSFVGHVLFGVTAAVTLVAVRLRGRLGRRPRLRTLARGVAAGVLTGALVAMAGAPTAGVPTVWVLGAGAVTGLGYPLLFGASAEGSGPATVRGAGYGFLVWILLELTAVPLVLDGSLAWAMAPAGESVDRLPAALLIGAGTGLGFTVLGAAGTALFADDVRRARRRSPGGRALVALGLGAAAGLAGGAVFTVVLVLVGGLSTISGLVGSDDIATGVLVHLVVAQLIGILYVVLFAGRSYDPVSGLGWGLSYGVVWWVLGPLTLLPVLTGGPVAWSAEGLAAAFPALVGHLGYGAVLGVVVERLQDRADPWWFSRSETEARMAAEEREQVQGSAPALWGLMLFVALTVPVLVAG